MKISQKLSSVIVVTLFLLLAGGTVFGDTIRLKNGSVIKGKVVSFNQQEFTIVLDLGSSSRRSATKMTIAAEDIESIEFDATEAAPQSSPASSSQAPAGKYGETPRETPPASRDSTPPAETTPAPETSPAPVSSTPPSGSEQTPPISAGVEKTVSVPATADWTSTEIRVQRGQRISISASGEVDLGNGQRSSPGGIAINDGRKLITNKPTGALIAVVGDDNDDFIYIGRSSEFTAAHNGILFLSVNEGNLKDNAGSYLARIKVSPGK
ncbi:MAG TPA: hypothetical protein VFD58_12250 [Blastocatellia bacterium]|nr:hypothetical protein [Blastocatellia bacterium]